MRSSNSRRRLALSLESLEGRVALSGFAAGAHAEALVQHQEVRPMHHHMPPAHHGHHHSPPPAHHGHHHHVK